MTNLSRIPPPPPSLHDDRAAEILGSVRTTFAEKGFGGASMQDLARAAGMSAGNFYRYFPSKAAIVEALVEQDIAAVERQFAELAGAPDLRAALRMGFARRLAEDHRVNGPLWAEITATALRKSEIAPTCNRMEEVVGDWLAQVFARLSGLPARACAERYDAQVKFVILLVKAAAMRGPDSEDPALQALILDAIDRVFDEISRQTARG